MTPRRSIVSPTRYAQNAAAIARKLQPCGHPLSESRELPRDHPEYRALLFVCGTCGARRMAD